MEDPLFTKNINKTTNNLPNSNLCGNKNEDLAYHRKSLEEMKLEVTDLAAVVFQLKDQIVSLISKRTIKERNTSKEISNINTKTTKNLSYLQKLIDEDHKKETAIDILFDQGNDDRIDISNSNELDGNKFIGDDLDFECKQNIIVVTPSSNGPIMKVIESKDNGKSRAAEEVICYIKDENCLEADDNSITVSVLKEENDLPFVPISNRQLSIDDEDTFIVDLSRPNQCEICSESFESTEDLSAHMEAHPFKNLFNCILCDSRFRSRKLLRKHFLVCFKNNEERLLLDGLICTVCGRMYGDQQSLRQHKSVHSLSKPFACSHCSYRYLTQSALDSHIKTLHNSLNKFFCPFCDHSYISNNYLLVHIRSHTGEKPFKCDKCDYKAATPSLVARHMKKHSVQEEKSCDLCDYVCRGANNLRSHKSKMHRAQLIKCRVCGREFKNATTYSNHFLTHIGEKSYKCPICPYAGLTKAVLKSHMKIHSGTNLLICPHCSMPFRTKFSFKRHLCTHKEEKDVEFSV